MTSCQPPFNSTPEEASEERVGVLGPGRTPTVTEDGNDAPSTDRSMDTPRSAGGIDLFTV